MTVNFCTLYDIVHYYSTREKLPDGVTRPLEIDFVASTVLIIAHCLNNVPHWCTMANINLVSHERSSTPDGKKRSFADISVADADIDDLIDSWHRLGSPDLRHLAVRLVRSLGEDHL